MSGHRWRARSAAALVVVALAAGCGGGDGDEDATGRADAAVPGTEATGAPDGTSGAPASCPIDDAALSEAVGIEMRPLASAQCGFEAASPAPGQVIEVYYTPIDAMVFEGSAGEEVAGVGDGARWDTEMAGSLLVEAGGRHFSIQAVAMGDLPDALRPQALATTVAQLVLAS